MKCKAKPCKRHTFSDYDVHAGSCLTPYCTGAREQHCTRCGWYVVDCACHWCFEQNKIPYARVQANQQKACGHMTGGQAA